MKEQLITFETAKLAKKKGFNVGTEGYYVQYRKTHKHENPAFCFSEGEVSYESSYMVNYGPGDFNVSHYKSYSAPTQAVLQRWLREVHSLHIVLVPTLGCAWTFKVLDIQCNPDNEIERPPYSGVHAYDYSTFEEALEVGLQETLKLIK